MVETAKGNKTQKGGGYIFLYSSCLCHARHVPPFFHCNLLGFGSSRCIAPTVPDHRAPGKQQHRGANIWVKLKHHVLQDSPHLLQPWPRPWDSVISVILFLLFLPSEQQALLILTKQEAHCAFLLWSEMFIPSLPWPTNYRTSLPKRLHSQSMGWSNTECTMHLAPIY